MKKPTTIGAAAKIVCQIGLVAEGQCLPTDFPEVGIWVFEGAAEGVGKDVN